MHLEKKFTHQKRKKKTFRNFLIQGKVQKFRPAPHHGTERKKNLTRKGKEKQKKRLT